MLLLIFLSDILMISLLTYLTGGTDYQDMHLFAKERGNAWVSENRFCIGQEQVEEKSNEITAIPKVLESLEIEEAVALYCIHKTTLVLLVSFRIFLN